MKVMNIVPLNGTWFGGPNENFNQISSSAFNFLYEQLESSEILGDINFDSIVDILDIILVINQIFVNDYSDSQTLIQI